MRAGKWFSTCRPLLKLGCIAALAWLWSRYIVRKSRSVKRWGPLSMGALAGQILSAIGCMMGISGKMGWSPDAAMPNGDRKRQALVAMHPHGQFLIGPLLVFGADAMKRDSPWNGIYTAAADVVFQVPVFRELVLSVLGRSASLRMIDALLDAGHTVNIFPGGIHEQLATDPHQERCYFAPKLGFVREAIKHGVPLQPIYIFGENQQFDVPSWARGLSAAMKRATGAGVPICVPRFGQRRQPLLVQPGRPVEVGPPDASPSEERVRRVFRRYCTELLRLFDEHKDAALPADVAARGLQIIWRGHTSEDILAGAEEEQAVGLAAAERLADMGQSTHSSRPASCRSRM